MFRFKCCKCGEEIAIDEKKEFEKPCEYCGAVNRLPPEKLAAVLGKIQADFRIEGNTLKKYKGNGGKVVVPFYVEHIADNAFDRCAAVKEVLLPASVMSVGNRAFQGCTALVKINLGGVQSIGDSAFKNCKSLLKAEISAENLGANAFENCASLNSVKLMPSVVSVGDNAFKGCGKLNVNVSADGAACVTAKDKERLGGGDIKITVRKVGKTVGSLDDTCGDSGERTSVEIDESAAAGEEQENKNKEKYDALVKAYAESGDAGAIKSEITNFNIKSDGEDIESWYAFIVDAAGAADRRQDKQLLDYLLDHARTFDSKSSDNNKDDERLYVNIITAYPQLASREDWKVILEKYVDADAEKFRTYNGKIIDYIRANNSASCALDIFYSIRKNKKCRDIIKVYLTALLEDREICENVLNAAFFKTANGRTFANDIEKYIHRNYRDSSSVFEETAVWKSVEAVRKQRRKKNIIIAACCLAGVAAIAGGGYGFLNATNPATVKIDGKGIISVTYGESPDLSGYTVTYKKFKGDEITAPVTAEMLEGYDPEKIGTQQAVIKYKSASLAVTVTLSPAQLETPLLTQSGNSLSWNQIEHADGYSVYVTKSAEAVGDASFARVTECSYDFKPSDLAGKFYAYVVAYSNSEKYSSSDRAASLALEKLPAVSGVSYESGRLVWDDIAGADHYMVSFNGETYQSITENALPAELREGENTVTVHAYSAAGSGVIDSVSGDMGVFKLSPVSNAVYKNDRIEWTAGERANRFSVSVDGGEATELTRAFYDVSGFEAGVHTLEITCIPDAGGVVASESKTYSFAVNTPLSLTDGELSWSKTGDEYAVYIDGEKAVDRLLYTSLNLANLELSAGKHTVCVVADGAVYGKTIEVNKLAVPRISLVNQRLSAEDGASGLKYYLDGEPLENGDLTGITAARTYRITAENAAVGEFEIASGKSVELVITKLAAPTITGVTDDGKLTCGGSGEIKYYLVGGGEISGGDISNLNATSFSVYAVRVGGDNELDSQPSATQTFTRAAAPVLSYDKQTKKFTVTGGVNVEFYCNGERTYRVGSDGSISGLEAGVYIFKVRNVGATATELASAFSNEVTVFYTDVTVKCTKTDTNLFNLDLDSNMQSFVYDLKLEFYSGDELIDTDVKVNQTDRRFYYQSLRGSDKIVVTITIKGGNDTDTVVYEWKVPSR